MRSKCNTRHLRTIVWYPVFEHRGSDDGTHFGATAARRADDRLHQLGRGGSAVSPFHGRTGAAAKRQSQPSAAPLASSRGGLLRDCPGALHAGLLPRGAALLAGRAAVAAGSAPAAAGDGPLGDLASPHAAGLGAARATPRQAAGSSGGAPNQRRFLSPLAAGVA